MIEEIVTRSKRIESALAELGASGRGLHEKLNSLGTQIDGQLARKIRFVASVRNSAVHDDNAQITPEKLESFRTTCDEIDARLSAMKPKSATATASASGSGTPAGSDLLDAYLSAPWGPKKVVGTALAAAAVGWYYWRRLSR